MPSAAGSESADATPHASATFDSGGVPIYYEVFGTGKAAVLIHGFMSNLKQNWVDAGWIEALTPVRRAVALDCRGHGRSGRPPETEANSLGRMADDAVRLLDHLGIERADVFGYSMGAEIALTALRRHPERFTSAVLGGFGDYAGEWDAVTPETFLVDDASTITDPFARAVRGFAEANGSDLRSLAANIAAYRPPLEGLEPGRITVPVLVVNGETDDQVGSLDALFAAVPHARLMAIPGRDHLTAVPDARFKKAVVEFLREQDG